MASSGAAADAARATFREWMDAKGHAVENAHRAVESLEAAFASGALQRTPLLGQMLGDAPVYIMSDDGDLNQEAITNDAVAAWESMPCYHFELNDNPGVNHYVIPDDPAVLGRLLTHLQTPRSDCDGK